MTLPYVYLVCYFSSLITGCIWPELSPMLHIVQIICLGGFIVSAVIVLGIMASQARRMENPTSPR